MIVNQEGDQQKRPATSTEESPSKALSIPKRKATKEKDTETLEAPPSQTGTYGPSGAEGGSTSSSAPVPTPEAKPKTQPAGAQPKTKQFRQKNQVTIYMKTQAQAQSIGVDKMLVVLNHN